MNGPTLKQAMIILNRRKLTVASKVGSPSGIVVVANTDKAAQEILIGTDLTVDQVADSAAEAIKTAMVALLLEEIELPSALASLWADGVVTGLILADLRAKAALHEEQQMRAEEAELKKRRTDG